MKPAFLTFALLCIAIFGFSQDRTPRADTRQYAQRTRVHQGIRAGEITRREAAALSMEQRHIRRSERRMKADGEVTLRERRRLENKQDRASRHIRRTRHNAVDRHE